MPPYRAHWGSIVNTPGELERYAESVLREGGPNSRLLVLLDADGFAQQNWGPNCSNAFESVFRIT